MLLLRFSPGDYAIFLHAGCTDLSTDLSLLLVMMILVFTDCGLTHLQLLVSLPWLAGAHPAWQAGSDGALHHLSLPLRPTAASSSDTFPLASHRR